MRKPFIVYKRSSGKKRADCCYVGFLDRKTNTHKRRFAATSLKMQIGDAAYHLSVSARAAVEEMARIAIARHIGTTPGPKLTVGPYLESFWNLDGEYALRQARSGQPLTIAYLRNSKSIIKARAITWLRKGGHYDDLVQSVTTGLIEDMLMDLFESGVSAKQCNTVRRALSKPFAELERRGTIYTNPVTHTLKFWEKKSERQILNLVEAKKFFSIDQWTTALA